MKMIVGCDQNNQIYIQFLKLDLAMNRDFHNKRQSLTVTHKQAGVDKLFD